ncbi:hypothetical protein [Streptomyces cavernicola]|uniref:Uncharacterized protein n=1 Tax=Streptomyces cavernicola TaxID=3043613 RepID=A0ABT6SJU2_9ACTN|nr:hypothetical protein [Streptomyces sp. B-S-A6]MDI3408314.1 hypothetical protein [Streptomyces sp. B-S-A6]
MLASRLRSARTWLFLAGAGVSVWAYAEAHALGFVGGLTAAWASVRLLKPADTPR